MPGKRSPAEQQVYDRRWFILGVLCFSLVLVVLANSVLNVAIPSLAKELRPSDSQILWIIDSYALVFGGLLLTLGALGDRYGRQGALQWGLFIFGASSGAAMLFENTTLLIVMRGVMGLGAALVMPATLSILTNVFPVEERGKAIGIWAAFAGIGGALGPILGGFLLDRFWWGSIFALNIPVVAVAIIAGMWILPKSRDPFQTKLDPVGAVLSTITLASLLFGIIEGPEKGWGDAVTLLAFATAVCTGMIFARWELTCAHPMLDIRFFRFRSFTVGTISISFMFFGMLGMFFLLVQYLQFVLGYSAFETGVRMIPFSVGMIIFAPTSDSLAARFGANRVVATGLLVAAGSFLWLAAFDTDTSYLSIATMAVILGSGMGLCMAPATAAVMADIPPEKAGVGSAVNDTTREVGGAIGVAVLGSILRSGYKPAMSEKLADQIPPGLTEQIGEDFTALQNALTESISVAFVITESEEFAANIPPALLDTVREGIQTAASSSFVEAMTASFLTAAAITTFAAAIAAKFMPRTIQARYDIIHEEEIGEQADEPVTNPPTAKTPTFSQESSA